MSTERTPVTNATQRGRPRPVEGEAADDSGGSGALELGEESMAGAKRAER